MYVKQYVTVINTFSYVSAYNLFKAMRIIDPGQAIELKLDEEHIDILMAQLPVLKEVDASIGEEMKKDIAKYLSLAKTFSTNRSNIDEYTRDILQWWRTHRYSLHPAWAFTARIVLAISCNSAASERVFSLMKNRFGKHSGRDTALADQLKASIMLAFNKRLQ